MLHRYSPFFSSVDWLGYLSTTTAWVSIVIVSTARDLLRIASSYSERATLTLLSPINFCLSIVLRKRVLPKSVLHVSYPVHTAWHTVALLRDVGWKADYLAIGSNPHWRKFDYLRSYGGRFGFLRALKDFWFVWWIVSQYEVLHLHFLMTPTRLGWELRWLHRMGRKVVVHYRGCEGRNRERIMSRYPNCNICQQCDYGATVCKDPLNQRRVALAYRYASCSLVTTPDLLDHVPNGVHFPFFHPLDSADHSEPKGERTRSFLRVVHVTNHPGIEGTAQIEQIITELKQEGVPVELQVLRGVSHREVLKSIAGADVTIGKMKMGYYANFQVESLALGVPAITFVRSDLMNKELEQSGLIFSSLDHLKATLKQLVAEPEILAAKQALCRASIRQLHQNERLIAKLDALYTHAQ